MTVIRTDCASEALADRAAAILLRRWGRRIHGLRVEMRQSGVVLYGWAQSYYAKQLAQHAAAEAAGLPVSANAIEVV
jgi:hypothetical protein